MFISRKPDIKSIFIDPPVLITKRLKLRKIGIGDIEDMYEYSKDPETSKYLLWTPHEDIYFTEEYIKRIIQMYSKKQYFTWGIEYSENSKFIGTCGFTSINERKNIAEVGYVLSPEYHRMKIAPEALYEVMRYGFENIGFDMLYARFMEDNIASRKVLERFYYSKSDTKPEYFRKNGKNQRIITYSISKEEYFNNKNNIAQAINN